MRLSHPTWRTDDELQTELHWLQMLASETTIGAPKLFLNTQGQLITSVTCDGVPEPRRAVLMSWVRGRLLSEQLSPHNFTKFGVLAARLHEHGAKWRAPSNLTIRVRNSLYVRGENDELHEMNREMFPEKSYAIFEQVRDHVQQAYARLYRDGQGVRIIHADLHQENVKVFRGTLSPFDFEDSILGYPVQDIAQTFYDLLFFSSLDNTEYQLLRDAFIQGYRSEQPWPEAYPGQIDTFMAGQQLWRTNFVIRYERPHACSFITSLSPAFRDLSEDRRLAEVNPLPNRQKPGFSRRLISRRPGVPMESLLPLHTCYPGEAPPNPISFPSGSRYVILRTPLE